MNTEPDTHEPDDDDAMTEAVRQQRERELRWQAEGRFAVVRFVGQIGILGWIIVAPILIGVFVGRWLDHKSGTGIFWSAPLLFLGAVVGFWSAWKWMHKQ